MNIKSGFASSVVISLMLLANAGGVGAEGFRPWGEVFDAADVDRSGALSKAECDHHPDAGKFPGFGPWFRNHFTDMDANGDGELTKEEMAAGMAAVETTPEAVVQTWKTGIGFQPPRED